MRDLTKNEKINLSTTEIAKKIRKQLKKEFNECKFSVRTEYYSMGSSITISLIKSDRKIKLKFKEIPEIALCSYLDNRYTKDELKKLQESDYHQLNPYILRKDFKKDNWCNGVFLTFQGFMLLKRICQIADYYNYDDSDIQTDYYSVNFSFSLQLGKWNKPFIDKTNFKIDNQLFENIKKRQKQIEINTIKAKKEEDIKLNEERQYKKLHKPNIPNGATHIIDETGFRELTKEEKETGFNKKQLNKRWFNNV